MNRRMLSTNEQINMIRSPNSMLFDLRNPSMSDMREFMYFLFRSAYKMNYELM
ncbi:unnamed protein product [Trichobilharzia regenti]|nr:unnamed protein product [Trichobilharzia regenti]